MFSLTASDDCESWQGCLAHDCCHLWVPRQLEQQLLSVLVLVCHRHVHQLEQRLFSQLAC
jgi:hypothetical protein